MVQPLRSSQSAQRPTLLFYELREQLAIGGQATVYRARHVTNRNLAAVKIIALDLQDPQAQVKVKTVLREMRIHETLKHQAVLKLLGGEMKEKVGVYEAGLWIALELGECCAVPKPELLQKC